MAKAHATIDIQRPPDTVWDYLTDFPRNPEWLTQVQQVRMATPAAGVGTQIVEVRRMPGRTVEGVVEITEWLPPQRLRKVSPSGALRADGLYKLAPTPTGGTHLTFDLSIQGRGFMKLIAWFIGIGLQKDTEQVLRNLKERLEAQTIN